MKAMALSGVFVLASAGLALASVEAGGKPVVTPPAQTAEDVAIAVKKPGAPGPETVAMSCDGTEATAPICAEADAKN